MQNNILVVIKEVNGDLLVSSRDVALGLEKEHSDITRKVEEILSLGEFSESEYVNERGRKYKEYLLNKDSFILLLMNYSGYNDFKRAYIKRFNEMENALKEIDNRSQLLLSIYKGGQEGVLASKILTEIEASDAIKPLQKQIETQQPKVDFANRLLKSKDNILVREFSKIMQEEKVFNLGEKKLYAWFRDNKYLMQNNEPYQTYMKYFVVEENTIDTPFCVKSVKTTKINPDGQVYFYSKLKQYKDKSNQVVLQI